MKLLNTHIPRVTGMVCILFVTAGSLYSAEPASSAEYYTEPQVFKSRPDPKREYHFGDVGVTGLKLRIYRGVVLKVEKTIPGTPADGKFMKGEIISGVNGVALKGHNPYVVLGEALTHAEAGDGKLVFDVVPEEGKATKQVTVVIPVLGAYSPTWPLNCKKSQAIIKTAAAYYAKNVKSGVEGALACLFLLSTGDDQYLPVVKSYFDKMSKNVKGIGDHSWNNGYNGIACGEYYLRTGDQSVLPVMQYFCDDARNRQAYGVGWVHWGKGVNVGYVAGGLMNAASAQMVTTLLLAKECGVNVDESTLRGALGFFYRFAGHGGVPYGDHRGEGGLGSNGKDGMGAAIMQIASGAKGDVGIYTQARDCFAMSMLDSYPCVATGHGDAGRGDAIWRGIASSYVLDLKPAEYHATMTRLQWWCDLSRRPSGALGVATCQRFDDEGSGAGVALAYTAPLKTLRITGAPRSQYAQDFTLPEQLWGRKADRDFLSSENGEPYRDYGTDEPVHVPYFKFGSAYKTPEAADLAKMPREEMIKNIYHRNYMIRSQAAKALKRVGALDELEKLLEDNDPRVRRAALDGLSDYRYWHLMGKGRISTQDLSPAMLASLRKMLADPEEALYVLDGAMLAISCAKPADIVDSLSLIQPWTTCDEWWLRESAFVALAAAAQDEAFVPTILPILGEMLLREDRPQARGRMTARISDLARKIKPGSGSGQQISAVFKRAADQSKIISGPRAAVGGHYVKQAVMAGLSFDSGITLDLARSVKMRFPELEPRYVIDVVRALLPRCAKLPDAARQELTDLLYGDYRQELLRRMNADNFQLNEAGNLLLDTIEALIKLKHHEGCWRDLGSPAWPDRVWQFTSLEPHGKDARHPREKKRFRDVAIPAVLEKWYLPEFDSSKWSSGKAPIGKGVFKKGKTLFENRSTWGEGEFLLMRTTFELDSLDYDFLRIAVLANQGFHIYLNGRKVHTYVWWKDEPYYRPIGLGPNELKHLRKGANVVAVYANCAYQGQVGVGQFDIRIEGLRKAELIGENE